MADVEQFCAACNHGLSWHFADVTGVVRCMVVAQKVSQTGIIGIPYSERCECRNHELQRRMILEVKPAEIDAKFREVIAKAMAGAVRKHPLLPGTPICEDLRAKDQTPCTHPAKWITPNIPKRGVKGGRKVCGFHRGRYETFIHRCERI